MDYAHLHHNDVIRYCASNMQLHINSDAAYLVLPNARSWGADHLYLSNKIDNTRVIPSSTPNELILTERVTLRNIILAVA